MPSDDAAESGRALVSSMMKPIALTTSSPDAAGAGRTAVRLQLLNRNVQELARRFRPTPPAPLSRGSPPGDPRPMSRMNRFSWHWPT